MKTNCASKRGTRSHAAAALTLLSLFLWQAAEARAQWTTSGNTTSTSNNVGVGTATPSQIFHVHSIGTWAGMRVTTAVTGSTINDGVHFGYDDGYGAYVWNREATAVIFSTSNAERMRLDAAGNVGIGTTSPAHKLDVAGSVNASGLCLGGDCKTSWSQVGGGSGSSQWTTSGSSVYYNAGNVGLGTPTPSARLHIISADDTVAAALSVRQDTNPLFGFDLTLDTNVNGNLSFNRVNNGASASVLTFDRAGGNVGIGTASPQAKLTVTGGADTALLVGDRGLSGSVGLQFLGTGYRHAGMRFDGDNVFVESASISHVPSTWHGGGQPLNFIVRNGNVGINKANPTEALDVVGNITATGNISARYQDVAEWVPSTQKLEPGTVVVLDADKSNHVMASATSYDTAVAGVISAQPGIILGEGGAGKVMVATTGRVKVRVDATRAPVKVGDLLVTGDAPGVAMKSEPVVLGGRKMHSPGTIIGKALEPLASGRGEILVLLSLQ